MHDHNPKPSAFAIVDTTIASGCLLWLLSSDWQSGLMILGASVSWTWLIVSHYRKQGVYVGIRELVFFYIEISCWKVITGRVAHDRIHPKHADSEDCPCCKHDVKPVRSIGEFLLFQLIGLPMLMSVLSLKVSAVVFGPLIYIGFAFRSSDYADMQLDAKRAFRSSFKQIWIVVALLGIGTFLGKIAIYAKWSEIADWWNSNAFLSFLSPFIYPPAFLPFHITSVTSAVLLLVAIALVDHVMHKMDDAGFPPDSLALPLRAIKVIGRIRLILSLYTWVCLLWVSIPWLRSLQFPPVSFEILPH